MKKIPVLICGGGPVGLSLSLLLSRLGVAHRLVEKHQSITNHPKSSDVSVRTMEIFKSLGLESALRQYEMPHKSKRFLWMENIKSDIVASAACVQETTCHSPTSSCLVTQDKLEFELLKAAQKSHYADIRFSTRLVDFEQDEDTVTCHLFNSNKNESEAVACQFLIACDGAHSTVRKKLKINMIGKENIGSFLSVYCQVDLDRYLKDKPAIVTMLMDKDKAGGFIRAIDLNKKWVLVKPLPVVEENYSEEYCQAFVKTVIGDHATNVDIINTSVWKMAAVNAEKYREGRVFLAGDAAHRMPPSGGMGMNAGVQDVHNLAWKIAAVLNKEYDDGLLDSYFDERHPFNQCVLDWSASNALRMRACYQAFYDNDVETFRDNVKQQQEQHMNHIGFDFGFSYSSSQLHDSFSPNQYHPEVIVGMRAPHALIKLHNKVISTIDLFVDHYVLLVGEKVNVDQLIPKLPISSKSRLETYVYNKDFSGVGAGFERIYQMNADSVILMRPDGHVDFTKSLSLSV